MKRFYLFCLLFCTNSLWGQEIISSEGDFTEISNGSVSWTIGEPIVESANLSNGIVTQGFQQNYEDFLVNLEEFDTDVWQIYPNPFFSAINVDGESIKSISVLDQSGRRVFETQFPDESINSTLVNLNHLSNGVYTMLIKTHSTIHSTQIIKLNH